MRRFPMLLGAWLFASTATAQTATADQIADFYWRTGHPESAKFYTQYKVQPPRAIWKDAPKKAESLEQLIAEALKNNADIRVAESKVREAEAELNRARMKIAAEISALQADIRAAQVMLEIATKKNQRMQELFKAGSIEAHTQDEAQSALERAKADLAAKQAKLPYLLGRPTAGAAHGLNDSFWSSQPLKQAQATAKLQISDEEFARRVSLDLLGRAPSPKELKDFLALPSKDRREKWIQQLLEARQRAEFNIWADRDHFYLGQLIADKKERQAVSVPASPLNEKVRKALDQSYPMSLDSVTPKDLFEYLRDKGMLSGINVVVRAKLKKDPVTIKLPDPVPAGAILQFIEDELDVIFILREYGIVVVGANESVPPGAIRVTEFWKYSAAGSKK